MKKRWGRELVLLALPIVLLGGVAWYRTRGAPLPALSNPFAPGPSRLEYSRFVPIKITPLDVAQGYDWGAQTNLKEAGKLDVPANWRDDHFGNWGDTRELRLVYRIGTQWKVAPRPVKGEASFQTIIGEQETLKANLKTVPREAEEVRLRGKFSALHLYRGPIAPGWKAPRNLEIKTYGLNHFVTVESATFDIPVKAAGEAWPDVIVSRVQKIEAVEGKWLRDAFGEVIMVRFRAKPGADVETPLQCRVPVRELSYLDATGHPFQVFQDAKSMAEAGIGGSMRDWIGPGLPADQEVIALAMRDAQPRGGWGRIKMPITVTGTVSDGKCWPTPFRVQMRPEAGEVEAYGAQTANPKTP